MKSPFLGLRTVIFKVPDLEAARSWYSEAFKTAPYFDEPFYIGFSIGGYELGLQPMEENESTVPGTTTTYWGVDDIEAQYTALLAAGASESEAITEVGGDIKVARVLDPWNNPIGLIYNPHFGVQEDAEKEDALLMPEAEGITGLGGIFFKAKDPEKLKQWYAKHLGLASTDKYGTVFEWRKADSSSKKGHTVWSPFASDTTYFEPSEASFMINFRVRNLAGLLEKLAKADIRQIGDTEEYEYGKFAWVLDPEGNKIELWQSDDLEFEKICEKRFASH